MDAPLNLFVGGEWQPAQSGRTEPILNPATEEVIAEVAVASALDVDRAVMAAQRAFEQGFADTTPGERSRLLHRLAERIEAHSEELARLESRNVGKPLHIARGDVEFAVDNLRFFAGAAR